MTALVNNTQKDLPPLVRVADVARLLSVSKGTVHNLIQNGSLNGPVLNPKTKKRHHIRITRASLLSYYKNQCGHSLIDALNHGLKS